MHTHARTGGLNLKCCLEKCHHDSCPSVNPQKPGGAKWPTANQKRYISGTEFPIDLKPGCKFKFLCYLETCLKKMIILGHEGTLQGLYNQGAYHCT